MRAPASPPSRLCLTEDFGSCAAFFERVRRSTKSAVRDQTGFVKRFNGSNRLPRIIGYLDFSRLTYISTAAAVVLAAEFERLATLHSEVPPTVELDKWNADVFRTLYQLGFFEIVGLTAQRQDVVIEAGETRTMQIVSSKNADDLARVDDALQQLGSFLNPKTNIPDAIMVDLLTGLSEAFTNVTNHAYPGDIETPVPHINSLWVAATAGRSNNSLTIVVYDQGVTIPVTYPRMERLQKVSRFLARALKVGAEAEFENDGTYIRAAMRYGGSRTDQKHRGKGLPQMINMMDRTGPGTMTVYSRGGWCRRDKNGRFKSGAVSSSLGGTLVEWTVELSQNVMVDGHDD